MQEAGLWASQPKTPSKSPTTRSAPSATASACSSAIRDLEGTYDEEAALATATQNTIFKQQVRELAQENRSLQEKLKSARDNNRFADRRIAQLEARLAGQDAP
jgi:hypothetical protein